MQAYSVKSRENDPHALPDLEIFEITACEVAESAAYQDEQWEFLKRHQFRLAGMNSRTREAMLCAMVAELGITGGWFYWYCFPGCLPDSEAIGPFATRKEALTDAREGVEE